MHNYVIVGNTEDFEGLIGPLDKWMAFLGYAHREITPRDDGSRQHVFEARWEYATDISYLAESIRMDVFYVPSGTSYNIYTGIKGALGRETKLKGNYVIIVDGPSIYDESHLKNKHVQEIVFREKREHAFENHFHKGTRVFGTPCAVSSREIYKTIEHLFNEATIYESSRIVDVLRQIR